MKDNIYKSAVLLINLGSPEAATKGALRTYLKEFLSDERVIDLPRWQWLPILHGIILNVRPKKSAQLYQRIWEDGEKAPLIRTTEMQTSALSKFLKKDDLYEDIIFDFAMRYGAPSIESVVKKLKSKNVNRLLVMPMYPQYADATTASVFDGIANAFKKIRYIPELRFIHHWHDEPAYIKALVNSFDQYVEKDGCPDVLLHSFHGVPERYLKEGDPYFCFCHKTTRLFKEMVNFPSDRVEMVFQSRFGKEAWLQPYADKRIAELASSGKKHIAVMCPGFTADCLETLEEMAITNRQLFLDNGGEKYDYIPALNAGDDHIALLAHLVQKHTNGWDEFFS